MEVHPWKKVRPVLGGLFNICQVHTTTFDLISQSGHLSANTSPKSQQNTTNLTYRHIRQQNSLHPPPAHHRIAMLARQQTNALTPKILPHDRRMRVRRGVMLQRSARRARSTTPRTHRGGTSIQQ